MEKTAQTTLRLGVFRGLGLTLDLRIQGFGVLELMGFWPRLEGVEEARFRV